MAMDPRLFVFFAAMAAMLATLTLAASAGLVGEWRKRRSVEAVLSDLEALRVDYPDGTSVLRPTERDSVLQRLAARFPRLGMSRTCWPDPACAGPWSDSSCTRVFGGPSWGFRSGSDPGWLFLPWWDWCSVRGSPTST
ncbi:MAG: hypothetical protein ACWGSQ_11520 [Longimicrobiales bacterium]